MPEETLKLDLKWRIERLYVKKADVQLFDAPTLFEKKWQPQIDLKFHASSTELGNGKFEVSLGLDLTCSNHGEQAYSMSLEQAALIEITQNLSDQEVQQILSLEATNALFAYLRETTDTLAVKASLPPFAIAHVDFGRLVQEGFKRMKQSQVNNLKPSASTDEDELLN